MARQVSRDDYFEEAMNLLATEGFPALKQATVCKRLAVTTGSFYSHFGNWQVFTRELLHRWREERTLQIAAAADASTGPIEALVLLRDMACELPYRAEAAIRAWSLTDPAVAEIQALVDQERLATVERAMAAMFTCPTTAERWARTALYILIGFEQFERHPHDTGHMTWALDRLLEHIEQVRDR